MHAYTPPQHRHVADTLHVNGAKVADWSITDRENVMRKVVRIPRPLITSPVMRVEFMNHDPRSPAELGISVDTRKVGLALHTVVLESLGAGHETPPPDSATRYSLGTDIDFHAGGNAVQFESAGW